MRLLPLGLLLIFCTTLSAQKQYDVLIKNVTVISMESPSKVRKADVYFADGLVSMIGKPRMAGFFPAKQVIDGRDKFLVPGLYDMHVHHPKTEEAKFFRLLSAAGITACRLMKSSTPAINFRKKNNTSAEFPAMKVAFNIYGNQPRKIGDIPALLDSVTKAGFDFIKVFSVASPEYFDEFMRVANDKKFIVCGHSLRNVSPEKLLSSGYRSVEHAGYFDAAMSTERLDSLLNLAVQNKVFICPTLDWSMMVYHSVPADSLPFRAGYSLGKKFYGAGWDTTYANDEADLKLPENKNLTAAMAANVATKIDVLKLMREKGIKIIAGSDAEEPYQMPGFSLIEELKLIKRAGYTDYQLLEMATINAAAFFSAEAVIREDCEINCLLLANDPSKNISNLESMEIVFRGKSVMTKQQILKLVK